MKKCTITFSLIYSTNVDGFYILVLLVTLLSFVFNFRDFSQFGFNRLSRGTEAHNELTQGFPDPRTTYYKFMVVRHPLERLASAYNQIISGKTLSSFPNQKNMTDYYKVFIMYMEAAVTQTL